MEMQRVSVIGRVDVARGRHDICSAIPLRNLCDMIMMVVNAQVLEDVHGGNDTCP